MVLVTSQPPKDILNVDRLKPRTKSNIAREGVYIFGGVDQSEQAQGKLVYFDTGNFS